MKSPTYVKQSMEKLEKAGFEAYIVGGCVRDLLMDNPPAGGPKDWDITTNALPEQIQKIFPESVYENTFGTVGVKIKKKEETIDILEITTYRVESKYTDKRHPDKIKFTNKIEHDLGRRDFTINAMAMDLKNLKKRTKIEIVDPFKGKEDLKKKTIKAVGDPVKRFNEDALRMIRAIRFAVTLGLTIESKTLKAIQKHSKLIKKVANERIKDEFIKIIASDNPDEGILLIRKAALLAYILPELEKGVGVNQNKHHTYTIFKHLILALKHCPSNDYRVRLAALFHDIAKPQTKRGEGENATFYNHDLVGARISTKIMKRMAFSNEDIEKVSHLVKNHMFYYNVDEVSEAGVRRLLKKVGKENMKNLMDVRIADRLGSGVPKAKPYKLRHLEYLIDKVDKDPISVKNLKISGETLIKELKMAPGPKFGAILDCLLAEAIEDPRKNTKTQLKSRAKELDKIDLKKLRKQAKGKIEERKEEEDKEIKKKHWVK
jgi:tRNA nucleotidyltransferase (CCA-adding enzyme)